MAFDIALSDNGAGTFDIALSAPPLPADQEYPEFLLWMV